MKTLSFIIFVLLSFCFSAYAEGPWILEPPMNMARDQFAGGVINGKIYVFGGNGNPNGVNLKSAEVYNPDTMLWDIIHDNDHIADGYGVEELTSAVVDDKLYVFGAYGGIGPDGYYGVFNFNEMYDPMTDTWTMLAQKPTTVAASPSTVYKDQIYLFGGYYDSENPLQDHEDQYCVESYNPFTNTWRSVTTIPRAISNFGIATIRTKAYLFGGAVRSGSDIKILNDVITYDFQTDTWTTNGYQPLPVKKAYPYSSSAPVIDGKVYLIGGVEQSEEAWTSSKRVDIYDPVTNSWEEGTPLPLPFDDHIALSIGVKIYLIGGSNDEGQSKADVISLDTNSSSTKNWDLYR